MKTSLGARPLLFPNPVLLVGTYNEDGSANVMNAAWGGIACSQPPCISVSLRAATHSHGNIVARKAFTIGIPGVTQVEEADFFGLTSGRDTDKLAVVGFTAVRSELVDAPIVAELPVVLECELVQVHELGLHTQFIGEIKDVKADASVLDDKGHVDVAALRPLAFAAGYFAIGPKVAEAFAAGKRFVPLR